MFVDYGIHTRGIHIQFNCNEYGGKKIRNTIQLNETSFECATWKWNLIFMYRHSNFVKPWIISSVKYQAQRKQRGKIGYKRINGILFIDFVDSILWSGRIALIWIIQLILAQILASIMFHEHTKTKKRSLLIRLLNSFYDVSRYKQLTNIMQHKLTFCCCFFQLYFPFDFCLVFT